MAVRHRKQTAAATTAPTPEQHSNEESSSSMLSLPEIRILRERAIYFRWDVAPFGILYSILVMVDDRQSWISTALFVSALLSHLVLILMTQWSWRFRAIVGYEQLSVVNSSTIGRGTHCYVKSEQGAGIVPLLHLSSDSNVVASFTFQDCVYRYCEKADLDLTLWDTKSSLVSSSPRFRPVRYPIQMPISFYKQWQGHPTLQSCKDAQSIYGMNSTVLSLPSFTHLLSEQLVAPFFIFQLFCVGLWSLDEYWIYALFTLCALLLFECTIAYNRLMSLQRLDTVSHRYSHQRIWVRRMNHDMSILIPELLPGDIVRLANGRNVPADIVLTQGTAVCDEAMLTGESIPQRKHALDDSSSNERLDLHTTHKESILFGGTTLVTADAGEDGRGVTGIVLRTGFETAQGNLLRTMAFASKSTDAVHTRDTFLFILLLILCAIAAAAFVLYYGWYDDRRNRFRLILHVIILITSVVPPELPLELSLAITNSVTALMKRCSVYCTEHYRIAWAGEITVCCFDKTGTLTSDTMLVKGIRLFSKGKVDNNDGLDEDEALEMVPSVLPWETVRVMVACQSLATTGRSLVGDPLERAVLEHSGYILRGNDSVWPNTPVDNRKPMTIYHRFPFSSQLKRMTVLASEVDDTKAWAVVKGAPETIKEFLSPDSIPDDYDEVSLYHMSRGRRVLAMASKECGAVGGIKRTVNRGRDVIEQDLTFNGFLVLECPLKPNTTTIMSELKKGGHAVVMITGDALLTAVEVARQVGILKRGKKRVVYRIQPSLGKETRNNPLAAFECRPLSASKDESTDVIPLSDLETLFNMKESGKVSFCISGDTLVELAVAHLSERASSFADEKMPLLNESSQKALARVVKLVSVFARHTPHQKEAVVAALNLSGEQTLMAGDGTNDVGALKRAHVGISIISAPEIEAKQRDANKKLSTAKSGTTKKKVKNAQVHDSIRQLQEAQDDLAQVELGDASVAAPFTSRALNIRCCKDVIQQGRCTLVTMLQIYKILGINCLVNALVLSKLFLHGVKEGDRQLTALGMVVAALFYFVTRAEPLSSMSSVRPPASVLCSQALLSITGQFAIHSAIILIATQTAISFVDPFDPSLVPDGPFNANVLNTCAFLSRCLTTVNTFAFNYRGRPFMKDLKENKLFYRSLLACYSIVAICTLEIFPPLNEILQLAPLPLVQLPEQGTEQFAVNLLVSLSFPGFLFGLMVIDTILVFWFERMLLHIYEGRL